jgi:hypothetical protein
VPEDEIHARDGNSLWLRHKHRSLSTSTSLCSTVGHQAVIEVKQAFLTFVILCVDPSSVAAGCEVGP